MITRQIMPIRARKDIKCYKVLRVTNAWNDIGYTGYIIVTPFIHCTVSRCGILQAEGKMQCVPINDLLFHSGTIYKIGEGAIHAYTSMDTAIYNTRSPMESFIAECIIEKGTLYYKSYEGGHIAAEKMKIVKIVKYPTDPDLKEFLKEIIDNYFTNLKSI